MKPRLTEDQIVEVCQALLRQQRRVGVREVMDQLHRRYGVKGRTERIAAVLKDQQRATLPSPSISNSVGEVEVLLERVRIAEKRAAQAEQRAIRAEELERKHQDFWAARYAERAAELERRYAELARPTSGISTEQYLKVCQANAELTRRLELYDWERAQDVDKR